MSHFMKLTNHNGHAVLVRRSVVVSVFELPDVYATQRNASTLLSGRNDEEWYVKETLAEVMALLDGAA